MLATTATTMGGFLPLFLFTGGEFWPPLAVAIAGGVAGATLLALYLVPSAYILLTRRARLADGSEPDAICEDVLSPDMMFRVKTIGSPRGGRS